MRKKFAILLSLLALTVVGILPAFAQDGDDMEELPSIAEIVVESASADEAEFTILLAAVEAAGLVDALDAAGPFTVFAPTDAAFAEALTALEMTPEEILGDTELLTSVLLYHVVPGTFYAEDVAELDGVSVATAFWGSTIDLTVNDDGVFVDDATVVATDIEASNGVVHVIDTVILPDEDEGTLRSLELDAESSIVEIASSNEDFSTLVAAVLASPDAATYVTSGVPFTVFAPTNDAFAAALEALDMSAEDLLADTDTLTSVLAYHIVPFPFLAEDVIALNGAVVGTLLPHTALTISLDGDSVFVNDSQVIITDVVGTDGVIHAIDSVLLPSADDDMMDDEMMEDEEMEEGSEG